MSRPPRVALFTDTFHEVNGVALTCRQFAAFARRRGLPFMRVHPGPRTASSTAGDETVCELAPGRYAFGIESDLKFDLLFTRHLDLLHAELGRFQPDVIHITAPGHCSILGVILAQRMRIPLAASWHTNVHQFGARRFESAARLIPSVMRGFAAQCIERVSLRLAISYYRIARTLFAPNPELISILASRTGKPVYAMARGVDTSLFCPRAREAGPLTIGYVGRLTPEKNVRLLAEVERALHTAGIDTKFVIVGEGSERAWLEANLRGAECRGVLHGHQLAAAYASMDIFAFPSRTDTYGNVVQEAKACGVPVVVTDDGGPKFLVKHGVHGLVAGAASDFVNAIVLLAGDADLRRRMGLAARRSACESSWDAVFEDVYSRYDFSPSSSSAQAVLSIRRGLA